MGKDNLMNFWYNVLTLTVLPWQHPVIKHSLVEPKK